MQLLALAFVENAPAVFKTGRVERQAAALLAHIEAEGSVKVPRLFEARHRHAEMIERVDAETPGRRVPPVKRLICVMRAP